ncbi:hypothetical protein PHAVU_001G173700 [Phaseolus vulgaris]|uniref:WRKY domain-containing protein n=1 Tax=Phaseolus vulgaris TaxID=3885 RepID=V7CX01_PHAVU|nr:hypothetical protein PHAVU_001G173700g [Phaseolus vulgaris]ESW34702.1 hypothetical protein PHAVU_001G173700g [Phaseolus vulgaris]
MDIKEAERVVIAKPVASRPTCSTFKSFSELLAGAINVSPDIVSSQATVSAIRPKTVRFKPTALNHPPAGFDSSQADTFGAALSNPSEKSLKLDTNQSLIYKPTAKLVSKTTVSLLANMGNCSTGQQQTRQLMEANFQHSINEKCRTSMSSHLDQSIALHSEINQISEPSKMVQQNTEEDQKTLTSSANCDRPSYDGYNWRKYGQKQVKGSEYPRSYYKCTHPNCPVKKKVERSFDGQIAEIVYKGEHNHSKPQLPKRNTASGTQGSGVVSDGMVQDMWSNSHSERNEGNDSRVDNTGGLSALSDYYVKVPLPNDYVLNIGATNAGGGSTENSCGLSGECEEASKGFEAHEEEPRSKRRKNENHCNEVALSEEGLVEPRIVMQSFTDSEILGDGFRWRKYGQKVVKGNPYPRSYYRCTNIKCNVRKHVERALDDPRSFVTTYEGKHNHEMPLKNTERDSQASLSKDKPHN